jgi:hypothetical protein
MTVTTRIVPHPKTERDPISVPVDIAHDRCPGCCTIVAAQLQILAERLADVAKLPRLMLVCGGCQRTFIVAPPLTRKRAAP